MSIVMNVYYTGQNGSSKEFIKEMQESGIIDAIRNEPGNERYDYFQDLKDPETILLIDSWKDQNALDLHHDSALMDRIVELRHKYKLLMHAERYLTDNEGIPKKHHKYLS